MKNNITIVMFMILFLLLFPKTAKAAVAAPWEAKYGCEDGNFLLSDAANNIQVKTMNDFLNNAEHKKLCVISGTIGGIVEDTITSLTICPGTYSIPLDSGNSSAFKTERWGDVAGVGFGCCPAGYPYLFEAAGWGGYEYCSKTTALVDDPKTLDCTKDTDKIACLYKCSKLANDPNNPNRCSSSTGAGMYDTLNYFGITEEAYRTNMDKFFVAASEQMWCNYPNCIYSFANEFKETKTGPYTLADQTNLSLVCKVDQSVYADYTCVKGTWYLTSVINDWGKNLGEFLSCNEFVNTAEKENCLSCYKDCRVANTCSYSSLGCIQTTQDGIIVRVFQIGLGIVGALAIARFIQAALLRQTADPSKIQESYDIITSIIIGIVVLLGSSVILRFIGVDILQMMPF